MNETTVGKIKNISFNSEDETLEVTVVISNKKFQKKLLRDLSLHGKIKFESNKLIYLDNIEE